MRVTVLWFISESIFQDELDSLDQALIIIDFNHKSIRLRNPQEYRFQLVPHSYI